MKFDLDAHARAIGRDGYTLIEDFMDAARLAEVRRVLGFYLGTHSGRNPFEGRSTERVYTLVARGRVFWDIALDTAENGGTEVIPGSHLWGDDWRARAAAARHMTVAMPAGACVVFSGTLVHRGGANRSSAPRLAFSNQYCQPWARQQENFLHGVPLEVARQMPRRLQEMLGYSVYPPFMGQLTASHPAKALEAGFQNRVEAQARAAGARLPE